MSEFRVGDRIYHRLSGRFGRLLRFLPKAVRRGDKRISYWIVRFDSAPPSEPMNEFNHSINQLDHVVSTDLIEPTVSQEMINARR